MSVKRFGIYIAFPPQVNLCSEGLGRHLAAFIKATQTRKDIQFVIACPSWSRESLHKLCDEENIDFTQLQILGPTQKPMFLMLFELLQKWKKNKSKGRIRSYLRKLVGHIKKPYHLLTRKWVCTRNVLVFVILSPICAPSLLLQKPYLLFKSAITRLTTLLHNVPKLFERKLPTQLQNKIPLRQMHALKQNGLILKLYRMMETAEMELMHKHIRKCKNISAWYSPTSFWPQFNKIHGPRLMCVPDVVLSEFPVGFANVGGLRYYDSFTLIKQAIHTGNHYVTYSEKVKQNTLVNQYQIQAKMIHVVPHGANSLNHHFTQSQHARLDAGACEEAFLSALKKSILQNGEFLQNTNISFLFYASQFRPNKNILSLIRAYDHLLKRKHYQGKLILTGDPHSMPEIANLISEYNLQNDVLCLHGLSAKELTACYTFAGLAVNPSFSEGGFPFTFTEALSVGTPVVMSRIAVTEEILSDPDLNEASLFDPYDWHAMAQHIEWALQNGPALYEKQRQFYDTVLVKRTWQIAVNEYVNILEKISAPS